ncbi:MAG: serine/threonine protein kinase [Cyanomargarita calcarea GSE-NOS-MK-12-04C]|jgi:serine/threonine-protein kinase|uniref:non-specific serine/threonine protein kinase n=1 Tax=Cyanomargarita calcarea GSE-NOS-MK-12-04C TaxID=2839659 RepID=A0A951QSA8_9CYAN|nr:serine/threonine protein kinase [Cyanomargarita calcarea GSE-NOS-MK-12-04C]
MEVYCTRPGCTRPLNYFTDLDDNATLRTVQQKYCTTCGMPLILSGRYLPIKLLGRGGFGAAFLARDRLIPGMRQCVVKQFLPAGNLTPTQMELAQKLFEREAEVLAELGNQHDQIPDLFAFFELTVNSWQGEKQDQLFYLVQEYINGLNLEEELAQKGKFSEAEVLEVLREILKVLKFVHENGSIHRDIKPSNIMRDRRGKLFLLDFGAVKQVTNVPSASAGSSTGIYSMGFAPPEQMAGGQVFPSTDLYALAVTLITLLTGKEATELFDGYSNQWNWRAHVSVSQHLADILDKMLLPAAKERFQSAQNVLDSLTNKTPQLVPDTQLKPPTPPGQPISPLSPPATNAIAPVSTRKAFSTAEILIGSAFSGFQGGLIAIALFSLLKNPIITLAASALILGGLILAQARRWIEKFDLLIISGITFLIIFFVPFVRGGLSIQQVVLLSVAAGLVAVALTSIFRLIYKILSLML